MQLKTLYHVHCTDCGRVIGSAFSEMIQPDHVLCPYCMEEACGVLDFLLGLVGYEDSHFYKWLNEIDKPNWDITGDSKRKQKKFNSRDIRHGVKKLFELGNNPTEVSPSKLSETKVEELPSNE